MVELSSVFFYVFKKFFWSSKSTLMIESYIEITSQDNDLIRSVMSPTYNPFMKFDWITARVPTNRNWLNCYNHPFFSGKNQSLGKMRYPESEYLVTVSIETWVV